MKKLIVFYLFLGVFNSVSSQKIVEDPLFTGTTAPYVNIKKITLSDTSTIIDFVIYSKPNSWIFIPKDTYIRNSEGGEKLFVKSAKGIKLKERHPTGETGVSRYSLYFPPVAKDVEKLDYEESQWKVFDIEIVPQEHFSIFPKILLGDWWRADGSGEWGCAFYEECVIFDSEIWPQVIIKKKWFMQPTAQKR